MSRVLCFAVALSLWASLAVAAEPVEPWRGLKAGGTARAVAVIDGDTVTLSDGRAVRLVGIQAPKLGLGRPNFMDWPLAAEAKAALETLVLGKTVTLHLGAQPMDRHGRVLAHLRVGASEGPGPGAGPGDAPTWVQGALLAAGLARVYTFPDNRLLAGEMLALERQARADRVGLWGLPYYAVRDADNVRFDIDTFQIVEGRVLDVARIKDRVYVNFGTDWRTDFTVKVWARPEKVLTESGVDLMRLKGQRVRVRGWVQSENGAMIELDHPERLEILGP